MKSTGQRQKWWQKRIFVIDTTPVNRVIMSDRSGPAKFFFFFVTFNPYIVRVGLVKNAATQFDKINTDSKAPADTLRVGTSYIDRAVSRRSGAHPYSVNAWSSVRIRVCTLDRSVDYVWVVTVIGLHTVRNIRCHNYLSHWSLSHVVKTVRRTRCSI